MILPPLPPEPVFPPHSTDLVDCLAEVARHWRRDDGAWCEVELRRLLDYYPWSKEVADWYGLVMSKIHHIHSLQGMYNLSEWIAQMNHAKMGGQAHRADTGLVRFAKMHERITAWLLSHNDEYGKENGQWGHIADIGAQHGEMTIHFVGIPGAGQGYALEISPTNGHTGKRWYGIEPRLHFITAFGEHLPLKDNSVWISVLSGILEHVWDPTIMLDEAERITKPGGMIVVQVPYGGMEGAPNPAADVLSFRGHVRCINPYTLLEGAKDLEVEYISYAFDGNSPHTWIGEVGDWVATYTVEE